VIDLYPSGSIVLALRVTQVQQEIKASQGTRDTKLKSYSIDWRIVQELDQEPCTSSRDNTTEGYFLEFK
jgi:hypothetical protein